MNQYEKMIHYHICRLRISDPEQEFFQEGAIALWEAYESFDPAKGAFAQFANYKIRNRFIDLIRKNSNAAEKQKEYVERHSTIEFNSTYDQPEDYLLWRQLRDSLTPNQWKYLQLHIIEDLPLAVIAKIEGTTIDAVKSWGKQAKKKARRLKIL